MVNPSSAQRFFPGSNTNSSDRARTQHTDSRVAADAAVAAAASAAAAAAASRKRPSRYGRTGLDGFDDDDLTAYNLEDSDEDDIPPMTSSRGSSRVDHNDRLHERKTTSDALPFVPLGFSKTGGNVLGGFDRPNNSSRSEAQVAALRSRTLHWSEKCWNQMTDRDWRIFREDHTIAVRGDRIPPPLRSWDDLRALIPSSIFESIADAGYRTPTAIQRQTIPLALARRDLIGVAQTGSGKTAAFVVPMLSLILSGSLVNQPHDSFNMREQGGPQALILAPTRELALQIRDECAKLARRLRLTASRGKGSTNEDIRFAAIVGGHAMEEQTYALRDGVHVVVATPGRLRDCLESRLLVLSHCRYVVLDEADKMLESGFEEDLDFIVDKLPRGAKLTSQTDDKQNGKTHDNSDDDDDDDEDIDVFDETLPPRKRVKGTADVGNPTKSIKNATSQQKKHGDKLGGDSTNSRTGSDKPDTKKMVGTKISNEDNEDEEGAIPMDTSPNNRRGAGDRIPFGGNSRDRLNETNGNGRFSNIDGPTSLREYQPKMVANGGVISRQTLMFSATMQPAVERLAKRFLLRPAMVTIGTAGQIVDTIEQRVELVPDDFAASAAAGGNAVGTGGGSKRYSSKKLDRLISVVKSALTGELFNSRTNRSHEKQGRRESNNRREDGSRPIIVFVNQKTTCEMVARELEVRGKIAAIALHGGKSQEQRENALEQLRRGVRRVLVATSVAARGIDVQNVALVVNFDLPRLIDEYVHRIGRTGRAGKQGLAISFVDDHKDVEILYDLRRALIRSPLSSVPAWLSRHEHAQSRLMPATLATIRSSSNSSHSPSG